MWKGGYKPITKRKELVPLILQTVTCVNHKLPFVNLNSYTVDLLLLTLGVHNLTHKQLVAVILIALKLVSYFGSIFGIVIVSSEASHRYIQNATYS